MGAWDIVTAEEAALHPGLALGVDGRTRCGWAGPAADYVEYHDLEWGRPVHGDRELFERFTLEAFQSGLSWLTILRKRNNFRTAFNDFDPAQVAAFGSRERERLLSDTGIVRNRAKVDATISNARALMLWRDEQGENVLDDLVWSFADDPSDANSHTPTTRPIPRPTQPPTQPSTQPPTTGAPASLADVPSQTDASKALAKALKRRGFVFVGPTTAYAAMQACGVVNDHVLGCEFRTVR